MTSGERGLRARARALPFWARMVSVAAVFAAVGAAAHALFAVVWPGYDRGLLEDEFQFVVTGALIGLISRWNGGYEAQKAAGQAIRRRGIPDDADPAVVRTGLENFRRANRRLRWWLLGTLVVIAVVLAVLVALRGPAWGWFVVAALLVLPAVYWPLVRNRLGRVEVLLAELDRREAAQS